MRNTKQLQIALIAAFFVLSFLIHLIPPVHTLARKVMSVENQRVLSVSKGFSINENLIIDVFKVQRGGQILIDIYDHNTSELIQSIAFDKAFDTYFKSSGRSANLFLDDINGDNHLEVIIPAYDKDLFARLHVLSFDEKTKRFKLIND